MKIYKKKMREHRAATTIINVMMTMSTTTEEKRKIFHVELYTYTHLHMYTRNVGNCIAFKCTNTCG